MGLTRRHQQSQQQVRAATTQQLLQDRAPLLTTQEACTGGWGKGPSFAAVLTKAVEPVKNVDAKPASVASRPGGEVAVAVGARGHLVFIRQEPMHADAAKPSEKASEGSVTEPSIQFGTLNTGAVQENKPPAKDKRRLAACQADPVAPPMGPPMAPLMQLGLGLAATMVGPTITTTTTTTQVSMEAHFILATVLAGGRGPQDLVDPPTQQQQQQQQQQQATLVLIWQQGEWAAQQLLGSSRQQEVLEQLCQPCQGYPKQLLLWQQGQALRQLAHRAPL
ncbi:hypothetical protein QJQ45_021732 [Haematococcus lacustris]|nr:hypothetical protein QJQ45_021732 [Haematococcus lacustris]